MAARDSANLTRNDYLSLYYALQELRSEPTNLRLLKAHISNGRYYNQPLTGMVRNMQVLLQSKDPNRKFPQTIRKEDVPQYFESLLKEVNHATEHDFYGNIERGVKQGIWNNIPSPSGENRSTPPSPPALPEPVAEAGAPITEESPAEQVKKAEIVHTGGHSGGSKPKGQGAARPSSTQTSNQPKETKTSALPRLPQPGVISKVNIPQRTLGQQGTSIEETVLETLTKPLSAQGQARPSRILPPLKVPGPVKDLGSQAAVQWIRHPILKNRIILSGLGAVGGYFVGGAPGAGVGALLGGVMGPNILSGMGDVITGGRSSNSSTVASASDDSEEDSGGGGSANSLLNRFLRNRARRLGGQFVNLAARRAALAAGRTFLAANAWWIILAIIAGVILLIVILMMLCVLPWAGCNNGSSGPGGQLQKVTIQKSAPQQVENGGSIEYKITVTNKGTAQTNVLVTDDIPADTVYESGDNDPLPEGTGVKRVQWDIKSLGANQSKTLTLKVKPQKTDVWVVNQATGAVASFTSYGSATGLLPTPLPPPMGNWEAERDMIITAVNKHPDVVAAYQKAGSLTGVPWEVLAGLHFVETGNNPRPTASLVSGREIGVREPDIPPSACAAGVGGPGTPIPMGGGCGFSNFEDSAIYAAKHIMGKIGERVPDNFQDAVTALSRYNGGGNRNCGRGVPYNFCPREFEGEDDPYSMAYFDEKHANMYVIYCYDGIQCNPFKPFTRPGSMAVIRALLGK